MARILAKQLLLSGTSIGANVRESQFAQSNKDFLHKLEIALEEARETQYWIDTLIESGLVEKPQFDSLLQEPKKMAKS